MRKKNRNKMICFLLIVVMICSIGQNTALANGWGWGPQSQSSENSNTSSQGKLPGAGNVKDKRNVSPVSTQGMEVQTDAYADNIFLLGLALLLLAFAFLLQYCRRRKNKYG